MLEITLLEEEEENEELVARLLLDRLDELKEELLIKRLLRLLEVLLEEDEDVDVIAIDEAALEETALDETELDTTEDWLMTDELEIRDDVELLDVTTTGVCAGFADDT